MQSNRFVFCCCNSCILQIESMAVHCIEISDSDELCERYCNTNYVKYATFVHENFLYWMDKRKIWNFWRKWREHFKFEKAFINNDDVTGFIFPVGLVKVSLCLFIIIIVHRHHHDCCGARHTAAWIVALTTISLILCTLASHFRHCTRKRRIYFALES